MVLNPLSDVEDKDVPALLALQRQKDIEEAYNDFDTFAELVCEDDETGEDIRQAKIHRAWTKALAKYRRALIWSHRYAGKTVQISILRTVWKLGRDPSRRFLILSATQPNAIGIVAAIAAYIKDETVQEIFPNLRPLDKGLWSSTMLDVEGKRDKKNPSVRAVGVGTALRGARCDDLVVDDILTPENTGTDEQRKKTATWLRSEGFGCLSKRSTVVIVGNAMHPDDILHQLAKQKNWYSVKFPILDLAGKSTWPEAWPIPRIEETRQDMGPAEFAKNMMCRARSDEDARFKQEWIDEALKKGLTLSLVDGLDKVPDGCTVWTGVDLAVSKKKKSDKTAFFTFMEDEHGNRTLLNVKTGKYKGDEIISRIHETCQRMHSAAAVEDNAAQAFLVQFAQEGSNLPIFPHTTSKKKRDPILGVEGLAIELANGKWTIPSNGGQLDPEVSEWITEMLYYSPKSHTGDRLMACYFARELARRMLGKKQGPPEVAVSVVGSDEEAAPDPDEPGDLARLFDVPETAADKKSVAFEELVRRIRAKTKEHAGEPDPEEPEAEIAN